MFSENTGFQNKHQDVYKIYKQTYLFIILLEQT